MVRHAYRTCFTRGRLSSPRENPTREVLGWQGVLLMPRARLLKNRARDIRVGYAAAKVAWDLAGRNDLESIEFWNPNAKWYAEDGRFKGENYGQRWKGYLQEAMHLLGRDPETRRAWVPVWTPSDIAHFATAHRDPVQALFPSREGINIPCCLGFALRSGELRDTRNLHMQVVMRSQSVGVMPYDVFLFSTLQELVANSLGMVLGGLHWTCLSLHLYEKEIQRRKAELNWWDSREFKQYGQIDLDHSRLMQDEMQEIPLTLDEAKERWPNTMDSIASGVSGEALRKLVGELDPVEELMEQGAERTWSMEPASV